MVFERWPVRSGFPVRQRLLGGRGEGVVEFIWPDLWTGDIGALNRLMVEASQPERGSGVLKGGPCLQVGCVADFLDTSQSMNAFGTTTEVVEDIDLANSRRRDWIMFGRYSAILGYGMCCPSLAAGNQRVRKCPVKMMRRKMVKCALGLHRGKKGKRKKRKQKTESIRRLFHRRAHVTSGVQASKRRM
jgi:hypothetical protein